MRVKRTIEITIETEEKVVLRSGHGNLHDYCTQCGTAVCRVTPAQASTGFGLPLRIVNGWIEDGRVHFTETGGPDLICVNSLEKAARLHAAELGPATKNQNQKEENRR